MDKLLQVGRNRDAATPRRQIFGILGRVAHLYETVAYIVVSAFLLFVLVNVALGASQQVMKTQAAQAEFSLREHYLTEIYPDFTKAQLGEIDQEMHGCKFAYAPFLGYTYDAVSGKWLHIDRHGFRRCSDNGPWPPNPNNLNVFVFGDSTIFGYQVTDDQTIPACLQKLLQGKCSKTVKVYNFGVKDYYSTLEQIQFSNLLETGIRPDVAVFIDGTSDIDHYKDEPLFASEMTQLMDERSAGPMEACRRYVAQQPLMELVKAMRTEPERITGNEVASAIHMYLENRRLNEAAANTYKVKTLFVWQPTPSYEYDLKYHPYPQHRRNWRDAGYGYAEMARIVKSHPQEYGKNFLWLADMQKQAKEPLYVDSDHYCPKFCEAIAGEIAGKLFQEKLITDNNAPDAVQPSGRRY
jgi:hypothetical protein